MRLRQKIKQASKAYEKSVREAKKRERDRDVKKAEVGQERALQRVKKVLTDHDLTELSDLIQYHDQKVVGFPGGGMKVVGDIFVADHPDLPALYFLVSDLGVVEASISPEITFSHATDGSFHTWLEWLEDE